MNNKEYWQEAVTSALDEISISLTKEQISIMADNIQISHENIGLAFHTPESPLKSESNRLEEELQKEREKVHCKKCNGSGRITDDDGVRSSNSECFKCRGEGRHKP